MPIQDLKIAIVGPCGAGKTTLAQQLQAQGFHARDIAQEHSFVPDMWRVITDPDVLIFLNASFETCHRRKHLNWTPQDHQEQLRRLDHARCNCDIYIDTDGMQPDEVLLVTLRELGVGHDPSGEV
jgi:cytidylate kinase